MNAPEMLGEILKLFPGLGVGLVIAWYVVRLMRTAHDAHVATMKEDHTRHLALKDEMITRLESDLVALRKERDRWLREATKKEKP